MLNIVENEAGKVEKTGQFSWGEFGKGKNEEDTVYYKKSWRINGYHDNIWKVGAWTGSLNQQ